MLTSKPTQVGLLLHARSHFSNDPRTWPMLALKSLLLFVLWLFGVWQYVSPATERESSRSSLHGACAERALKYVTCRELPRDKIMSAGAPEMYVFSQHEVLVERSSSTPAIFLAMCDEPLLVVENLLA